MSQAVKVAISLPAGLLEMAEHERQLRGESRSEFFRHALEAYLRRPSYMKMQFAPPCEAVFSQGNAPGM